MRPEMDVFHDATEECFAAYRKASIAVTCWGLFLLGVVLVVLASRMGWLPGVWWEVKP